MSSPTITKLMQLKADAVSHRERLSAIAPGQFTSLEELAQFVLGELGLNFAPMFESSVDAIHEDVVAPLSDLEDVVEEYLEETGDQLTDETAGQILAVLQQGRAVCNHLAELMKRAAIDAVTKKRMEQAIKSYRTSETAVRDLVEAITMAPDAEDIPIAEGDVAEGEIVPDGASAEPPAATGSEEA